MTVDDALARLTAGLDRDEATARAALGTDHLHESCDSERCIHDRRHDPARTLRQVEVIRKIIAEHADDEGYCSRCWDGDSYAPSSHPWPCSTLRALADIYAEEQR